MPNPNTLPVPQELLIIGAATESGIIEYLHRQKSATITELATSLQLDDHAVWTLSEALISLGYAIKQPNAAAGDVFSLSPAATEAFFGLEQPNPAGFAFMHSYRMIKRWIHLPEVLKTGQAIPREENTLYQTAFMHAMRRNTVHSATQVAAIAAADLASPYAVLDIGGGPLVHARAFAAAGGIVTVFDAPAIVQLMQAELQPNEHIQMLTGDFNQSLPAGPFNLAYLGNICHIYGPAAIGALFGRVAAILQPGGRIAITDFVRGMSPRAAVFGVNMLVSTETGGTWTLDQYQNWLAEAGFTNFRVHNVDEHQLMLAEKK